MMPRGRLSVVVYETLPLLVRILCALILIFLLLPLLIIIPLSFNSEPYFTIPMPGLSGRWYREIYESQAWGAALRNSMIIAVPTTLLATTLGTLAALGLTLGTFRFKTVVLALLMAPIMVPHIIIGLGQFFLYARVGIVYTYTGMILAHTTLATPFVVLTVSATLAGFNTNLMRAALNLGANPARVFRSIVLPLIMPGVAGGAVLAFVVSLDDVIVALLISGPEDTAAADLVGGQRKRKSGDHGGCDFARADLGNPHGADGTAPPQRRASDWQGGSLKGRVLRRTDVPCFSRAVRDWRLQSDRAGQSLRTVPR
jgi:putative spermidine/putrescine transport system permease protein